MRTQKDTVTCELLNAVKWLGNSGSHEANLEEHELATAYKIISVALDSLYLKESEEVAELARFVNTSKGPVR